MKALVLIVVMMFAGFAHADIQTHEEKPCPYRNGKGLHESTAFSKSGTQAKVTTESAKAQKGKK